jgi:hypothetical protein
MQIKWLVTWPFSLRKQSRNAKGSENVLLTKIYLSNPESQWDRTEAKNGELRTASAGTEVHCLILRSLVDFVTVTTCFLSFILDGLKKSEVLSVPKEVRECYLMASCTIGNFRE